jgi:hypothetical protein
MYYRLPRTIKVSWIARICKLDRSCQAQVDPKIQNNEGLAVDSTAVFL